MEGHVCVDAEEDIMVGDGGEMGKLRWDAYMRSLGNKANFCLAEIVCTCGE